ncbi:DoxX family protein [Pseudomonas sp. 5P_3.1_Bac2]|uniref:DoxX family protein n=1 Tax=Pseudomonas sp. 5P_3.1_Bac2 TaxID=2971617 RepID=UPI0021C6384E|nr:DoxX family protein [Pseudomonas sp. 5P_3.1_Bac2]MCU1716230.1 DoxX family protein [Pseudomonas sp. 5P_3.1_Bac2]
MTTPLAYLAPLGRLLIAYMFIPSGFSKLLNFNQTIGYIASQNLPFPTLSALAAIIIEIFVTFAFLVGFKTKWSALILALFTVATAVLFHNYWAVPQEMKMLTSLMFDKNIAIAGGLLLIFASGPGKYSIDEWIKNK